MSGKEHELPVSNQAQLEACAQSLLTLSRTISGTSQKTLARISHLLYSCASESKVYLDNDLCHRILHMAVAHAGRLAIDEMAVIPDHPGTSRYYRQLGFEPKKPGEHDMILDLPILSAEYFLTPGEADDLWQKLSSKATQECLYFGFPAHKITESNYNEVLLVDKAITIDEARQVAENLNPVDTVCFRIKIGPAMTAVVQLGMGDNCDLANKTIANLNRQDIWLNTVMAGLPFLTPDQPVRKLEAIRGDYLLSEIDHFLSGASLPNQKKYDRYARRRVLTLINNADTDLTARQTSLEKYYREQYSHEHPSYQPKIILTRSGNAANLVAGELIRQHTASDSCYIALGWYWETFSVLNRLFTPTGSTLARTLFLNCEPNNPCATDEANKPWEEYHDNLINGIIKRALNDPDYNYYLVLDRTACLTRDYSSMIGRFPRNLILIETASLTKHQRGEKNHFAGVCWVYAPDDFIHRLPEILDSSTGNLDRESLVYFPKITHHEIERNLETIKQKMDRFKAGFESEMTKLPEELRWQVETHSYYGYIKPPLHNLDLLFRANFLKHKEIRKYFGDISDEYDNLVYELYINDLLLEAFVRSPFNLERGYETPRYGHGDTPWRCQGLMALDRHGIPEGNSFGLQESVYTSYHYWSKLSHSPVNFLRLCPGIDQRETIDFYEAGRAAAGPVITSMTRLQKFDYGHQIYTAATKIKDDSDEKVHKIKITSGISARARLRHLLQRN